MSGSDLTFKTAENSLGNISKDGNIVTYTLTKREVENAVIPSTLRKISSDSNNIKYNYHGGSRAAIGMKSDPTFDSVTISGTPSADTDAVTKKWVDDKITEYIQGLDIKDSVACATTSEITLGSSLASIDGITLTSGVRVLVKDQTNQVENGIYIFNGTGLSRASDFAAEATTQGAFVFVEQGTVNAAKGYVQTNASGGPSEVTIGTDSIHFTQFNGTAAFEAGQGLTHDGNKTDVDSNLYFVTDMSGLTLIGSINITTTVAGNLTVDGGLDVSGATTLNNALSVADTKLTHLGGALDVCGNMVVDGTSRLNSTLDVCGNLTVDGNLDVSGLLVADTSNSNIGVNGNLIIVDNLTANTIYTNTGYIVSTYDTSNGFTGELRFDASYISVCVDGSGSNNEWREIEIEKLHQLAMDSTYLDNTLTEVQALNASVEIAVNYVEQIFGATDDSTTIQSILTDISGSITSADAAKNNLTTVIVDASNSINNLSSAVTEVNTLFTNLDNSLNNIIDSIETQVISNISVDDMSFNNISVNELTCSTLDVSGDLTGPTITTVNNHLDGLDNSMNLLETNKANKESPTFTGDVTVTGNFTVNGTTTTLNTTNLDVSDNMISLNNGLTGSPVNDSGILIYRGDASNVFMGWDESSDNFIFGTTDASSSDTGDLTITPGTINAILTGPTISTVNDHLGGLDSSMNTTESRLDGLDSSMNAVENKFDGSGVLFTNVDINDASGVYFSNDISFNDVTGNQPANFSVDYSGNLIMKLNNFFFRYNIYDVSNNYNGI